MQIFSKVLWMLWKDDYVRVQGFSLKTTYRSSFLSNGSVDNSLEDVLLGHRGLQVLQKSVCLLHLILQDTTTLLWWSQHHRRSASMCGWMFDEWLLTSLFGSTASFYIKWVKMEKKLWALSFSLIQDTQNRIYCHMFYLISVLVISYHFSLYLQWFTPLFTIRKLHSGKRLLKSSEYTKL